MQFLKMPVIIKYLFIVYSLIVAIHSVFAQTTPVDYSKQENWAVVPWNYPEEIQRFGTKSINDSIDVFYVYPTLILSEKDPRWNVTLDDTVQRNKVLDQAIRYQASAWSEAGNVYAPYYRQAHLRAYFQLENGGREALLFAYEDVKNAFAYYLEHYNKGKGIILAGHSQGSTHLSFILRDFFDGKPLQKQLVAAYIPGIGIEENNYQTIPFMRTANQVGGFVTWNTFKRNYETRQYAWYKDKAVINPVTWDTTPLAKRELHEGFLFSNGKMYAHSFDTHLENGIVWISKPHFPYRYLAFTMETYHVGDINLFWEDIRKNALLRASEYLRKMP